MKRKTLHSSRVISSICFVFILVGICFVSAFSSSTITASETQIANTPSFSLYLVCTSKSQLQTESETISKDIIKNDGAGFIWKKDNYYYVISSAYENKNDAELVSAEMRMKDIENEVIQVDFSSLKIPQPLSTQESKSTFNASIFLFYNLYKNLFDLSVSLDTKIIDETQALLDINRNLAIADEVKKNFIVLFNDIETPVVKELQQALCSANDTLFKLSEGERLSEKQTMLSHVRYAYCEICQIFFNFLIKIA